MKEAEEEKIERSGKRLVGKKRKKKYEKRKKKKKGKAQMSTTALDGRRYSVKPITICFYFP